jgi:hypothetical protein
MELRRKKSEGQKKPIIFRGRRTIARRLAKGWRKCCAGPAV